MLPVPPPKKMKAEKKKTDNARQKNIRYFFSQETKARTYRKEKFSWSQHNYRLAL